MKLLKYFMLMLILCPLVKAQSLAVTATITDSDSTVWANGTYSVQLVSPNGVPYYNGTLLSTAIQTGTLNSSGALAISLYNSSTITPGGAYYSWIICSKTSAPCSSFNAPVTGTNMSSTLSALVVAPRFAASPVSYGYADIEVSPIPVIGGSYFNVTSISERYWNGTSWGGTALAPTTTATTNPNSGDTSTQVATDQFTANAINFSQSRFPLAVTGGTYSFDSQGSGAQVVIFVTGGAVSSVITTANPGSGYAVGDLLFITPGGAVGGNGDAVIRVTSVSGTGFAGASIVYGGTGYTATGLGSTISAATGRPFTFVLTGVLTSNVQFIMKYGTYLTTSNQWIFANNTTGAFTTNVCEGNASDVCGGGSTVTLAQGTANSRQVILETDGELNMFLAAIQNAADLTFTGAAASNCNQSGTLTGVTSCMPVTVSGVLHYVPIF